MNTMCRRINDTNKVQFVYYVKTLFVLNISVQITVIENSNKTERGFIHSTRLQSLIKCVTKTLLYGFTTWTNRQLYNLHNHKVYHKSC